MPPLLTAPLLVDVPEAVLLGLAPGPTSGMNGKRGSFPEGEDAVGLEGVVVGEDEGGEGGAGAGVGAVDLGVEGLEMWFCRRLRG